MIKKKTNRTFQWICAAVLVLIAAAYLFSFFYCKAETEKLRTYEFTESYLSVPQDGLTVGVTVSNNWRDDSLHPDNPAGAQYDGFLRNDSSYEFRDWSATLQFSEYVEIDSSWNGAFDGDGCKVYFTAQGFSAVIEPANTGTFGAVMYATKLVELRRCEIRGYRVVNLTDLPLFWILNVFTVVWAIFSVVHAIISSRTKRFIERQELDSEIIRQSMNTFTGFIDAKDAYTKGHSSRVAAYASEIARRMKLSQDDAEKLYYITLMHDCGKIGVPDSVLKKPGRLTAEEFEIIKRHTTLGDSVLEKFTAIPGIRDGAHYHHERFDGGGYPSGLLGDEIPLCARIICVADSFDAMCSDRCYRKHLSKEKIISELTQNAGKQFDPTIVPYMIDMINDGFVDKVQAEIPSSSGETPKPRLAEDE